MGRPALAAARIRQAWAAPGRKRQRRLAAQTPRRSSAPAKSVWRGCPAMRSPARTPRNTSPGQQVFFVFAKCATGSTLATTARQCSTTQPSTALGWAARCRTIASSAKIGPAELKQQAFPLRPLQAVLPAQIASLAARSGMPLRNTGFLRRTHTGPKRRRGAMFCASLACAFGLLCDSAA